MAPTPTPPRRKSARAAPRHVKPRLVRNDEGNWLCRWSAVMSKPSVGRGNGLFAALPLRKGTRIDYYGVRLTRKMWNERDDQSYCVEIHGTPFELIDANPSWATEWEPNLPAFMPRLPAGENNRPRTTSSPITGRSLAALMCAGVEGSIFSVDGVRNSGKSRSKIL